MSSEHVVGRRGARHSGPETDIRSFTSASPVRSNFAALGIARGDTSGPAWTSWHEMERSGEPSVAELQAEQERADEEALNIAQQLRMLETLYALPEFTGDRLDRAAAVGSSALHGYEVAATAGSTAMALILVARSSEQMADSAAA